MDEEYLLRDIKKRDPDALEAVIDQYGAYVRTIVRGRSGGLLSAEDMEEITSDVFLSLWQSGGRIASGHLRGWLAAAARNRTVDALRRRKLVLPLEEGCFLVEDAVWQEVSARTLQEIVRTALDTLSQEDRELFLRHYELSQSVTEIAETMFLTPSAVKMRLFRGRRALKKAFEERGMTIEDCIS